MKMTIQNLGRIRAAEIDLRPLTVFVGPNGTNKTWTAYAAYSLLRELAWLEPGEAGDEKLVSADAIRREVRAIAGARVRDLPLASDARVSVEFSRREFESALTHGATLRAGADHLSAWIPGAGANGNKPSVSIALDPADLIGDPESSLKVLLTGKSFIEVHINSWGGVGYGRASGPSTDAVEMAADEAERFVLKPAAVAAIFPAERKALEIGREGPHPSIILKEAVGVLGYALTPFRDRALSELVDRFMVVSLGGHIKSEVVAGTSQFMFVTREGLQLPMASAASLAGAVTSLCLVLRKIARPGDILVIDELELHAHPDAQLALIELVAAAVNEGIRVILTTHSPYIVDHLNTLLEAGRANETQQDKLAEQFALRTRKAFLSADKVSVYSFKETPDGSEVVVKSAIDPETGLVVDSTFAPVTTRLSRLFNAALDAVEQSS